MSIGITELKEYATKTLETEYNASINYVCKILPYLTITTSVKEVENIASLSFVESLGDASAIWVLDEPITKSNGSPSISQIVYYSSLNTTVRVVRANAVWGLGYEGDGIRIAIIDSGLNATYPDFRFANGTSKIVYEHDYTRDNDVRDLHVHGTFVGIITAGSGEHNYEGVAPEALLLNLKVINETGQAEAQWIIMAIDDAIDRHAKVINLSLHSPEHLYCDGTCSVSKAVDDAIDEGVIVVKSAGNLGPGARTITCPGSAFNVITTGGILANDTVSIDDDQLWVFSSRGPTLDNRTKPDVVAPCALWFFLHPFTGWVWGIGTSFAAPHVSGSAALLLEANSSWTPNLVKDALKRTARLNTNLQGLSRYDRGNGTIDAFAAVQASPDGTYGWDPYWVESADESLFIFNVTRVENVPSLRHVKMWGTYVANVTAIPYVWISGSKYKLTDALLVSGPRVYHRYDYPPYSYVIIQFIYNVSGVKLLGRFYVHRDDIKPFMKAWSGGLPTTFLGYYDLNLRSLDHDYVMWTNGSIIPNEIRLYDEEIHYKSTQHAYPWIRFYPDDRDNPPDEWILRYHGGFTDNPETYKDGESIYDTNLVIYYKVDYAGADYAYIRPHIDVKWIHDVAVTSVTPLETVTGIGCFVDIKVVVKNEGNFSETFYVTAYRNATAIGRRQRVNKLAPGTNKTLTFIWDTSGVSPGNYIIKAEASLVPGETDMADNIYTNGVVRVMNVRFTLVTVYMINLYVNDTFNFGSSLKVMFYTYCGIYQANSTVWSGTTPAKITLSVNVTHPNGLPVERADVVITDEFGTTLETVASFMVSRSHLIGRLGELDYLWAVPGANRPAIMQEYVAIDGQWPYAPP